MCLAPLSCTVQPMHESRALPLGAARRLMRRRRRSFAVEAGEGATKSGLRSMRSCDTIRPGSCP